MPPDPSITIWIDTATQEVKTQFAPQPLTPGQYGVVLSALFVHIARGFCETNKGFTEEAILEEIMRGVQAGLGARNDMILPAKTH